MSEEDWRLRKALESLDSTEILPKYRLYYCKYCDFTPIQEDELREHYAQKHGKEYNTDISIEKGNILDTKVKTAKEDYDLTEIPFTALVRLAKVFREGHVKYGKGNWKLGEKDKEFQLERANHAIKHLYTYIEVLKGERESVEDDLAKVMWYCVTQMYFEAKGKVDK